MASVPLASVKAFVCACACVRLTRKDGCNLSCILSTLSITVARSSSFQNVLSISSVSYRDRIFAACCLTPMRCTTSKLNSDRHRHHRTNLSFSSVRVKIPQIESRSIKMVNRIPSWYKRKRSINQAISKHSH